MKLTTQEQIELMRRSCIINGSTYVDLRVMLNSQSKVESAKAKKIANTFAQLKAMQLSKKEQMRSCKESRGLVKELSSRLTPYEEYLAGTKKPESAKSLAWVQRVFERGTATQAEQVALLSQSSVSALKALDPFEVERSGLASDAPTIRSAGVFTKRFGLK